MTEYLESSERLNTIIKTDEFIQKYECYKKSTEVTDLINFLNNIELNKKYFRLTTNNKIGKNKHYRNKNISKDTLTIKEINSYLNKLTDRNVHKITNEIKIRLENKSYLNNMIIANILDKCIQQHQYITYYIQVLLNIYKELPELNKIIQKHIDTLYEQINTNDINTEQSEYLQFCDKNKQLDLLIGYSILITELEKAKILENKIIDCLNNLINTINDHPSEEERYKGCQCLYNIFKSFYDDNILPQGFIDRLELLKNKEKVMKIKFKIMDILERK